MLSPILTSPEENITIPLPPPGEPLGVPCRWLVSLDYDGTLRPEEESGVDPAFFTLMQQLRRRGVRWGVNTGRSLAKLAGELAGFPFQPDFVCTCERYAYLANAEGCLRPAAEHNARCHAANHALKESILPAWQTALHRLRHLHPTCSWESAADDPLSIEAADSAALDVLMPHISAFARRWAAVAIQRAGRFMRLSHAGFTKGSALHCVQQALHVPQQRLFLMGDGHNDLDAFRHFPQAFCAAPATAHPVVLRWLHEHGGYISPGRGVLHALRFWGALHALLHAK